jgi:hypothetical protein
MQKLQWIFFSGSMPSRQIIVTQKSRNECERTPLLPAVPFDHTGKTDLFWGMDQVIQPAHRRSRLRCSFHGEHDDPDGIEYAAVFPVFLDACMGNLFCDLVSQHNEVTCCAFSGQP